MGMLTFDLCCQGVHGQGFAACWDGSYTWERCCLPEIQKQNLTASTASDLPADMQAVQTLAPPGAPEWLRSMATCLSAYDVPETRQWFLAHSGIPAHFVAHVGNPAACIDGGHNFYWGLLVVSLNLAGPVQDALLSDVALEFSICVPRSCSYAVVDAVLVPFYLGPYLGKPWGPSPEMSHRFRHVGSKPSGLGLDASAAQWMLEILMKGGRFHHEFFKREWPFPRELWQYQTSWAPSFENSVVLAFFFVVPILGTVCKACDGKAMPRGSLVAFSASGSTPAANVPAPAGANTSPQKSHCHGGLSRPASQKAAAKRSKGQEVGLPLDRPSFAVKAVATAKSCTSAVSRVLCRLSPQACIDELAAPVGQDQDGVHMLRIVLQGLVCWQHTVLFGDWLGNAGHHGILAFLPLTHDVAKVLGRVNTTFACLTAYFSLQSISRSLCVADTRSGAGKPSPVRAIVVFILWCIRRWVRQSVELGIWTFYFLRVTQDVPWKPFPDFVQVWYRDRTKACRRWPAAGRAQLPMWLLSLLFIYEPVNGLLGLHPAPVSLCHNHQVFENLFAISVVAALLGGVRHVFGRGALFAVAAVLVAVALWREPPVPGMHAEDGRDMVSYSTLQMLPAAMLTALLLAEVLSGDVGVDSDDARATPRHSHTSFRIPCVVIGVGLAADFLALGHAHLLADWLPFAAVQRAARHALNGLHAAGEAVPALSCGAREAVHALGVALLLRALVSSNSLTIFSSRSRGSTNSSGNDGLPGWARAASRLSLSVNLTNIFALHYLRGRLLDHPVEFSHIHAVLYTAFAWGAALLLALAAHCVAAPLVMASEVVLSWLGCEAIKQHVAVPSNGSGGRYPTGREAGDPRSRGG